MKDKTLVWIFIASIWLAMAAPIYATLGNRQYNKLILTYTSATNCFAATSPPNRTPEYVDSCYDKAEQATGVKIERFGDGR